MILAVALLFATFAFTLPMMAQQDVDQPLVTSATGSDGRVIVSAYINDDIFTPGELVRITAGYKVLSEDALLFPQNQYPPLAFLYLRVPSGKVLVYPQRAISPKEHRLFSASDYRRPLLLNEGQGVSLISHHFALVNSSPAWREAETFERVKSTLRDEGLYEAWIEFAIPDVEGSPPGAWTGTVETGRIRFAVRELPVADRLLEPTPEQLHLVEAYLEAFQQRPLKKQEIQSLTRRLKEALKETENEGLASHVVSLLVENWPDEANQDYPRWWYYLSYCIHQRAYLEGYGVDSIRIFGPYLDSYAPLAMGELERQYADHSRKKSAGWYFPARGNGLLLAYVIHKPASPLRKRLEQLARRHAKIPIEQKKRDKEFRRRLEYSWHVLFSLNILREGMPFSELTELLGEPTMQIDKRVLWNYTTGSRGGEYGIFAEIGKNLAGQTIVLKLDMNSHSFLGSGRSR